MTESNVVWHDGAVHKQLRAGMKSQTPCIIWFTGLSGAGKSTLACAVEKKLAQRNQHTYLLDGDNVRFKLCQDLGFTAQDRAENIRRVGEMSHLMVDAGLIVLCAFISPFKAGRNLARSMFTKEEFIEVYMDTPISVCEQRDVKGLYKKARAGEIKDFTGINSPYEIPLNPEITIAGHSSVDSAANQVIQYLIQQGFVSTKLALTYSA